VTEGRPRRDSVGVATPETDPLTYEAGKIKDQFFSDDTLTILVRVLVTRYLPLGQAELESWNDDPEEFGMIYVNLKCTLQNFDFYDFFGSISFTNGRGWRNLEV